MANTSSYDAMFKEVVAPKVSEIFDNTHILARWLERNARATVVGDQFEIPVHSARNEGIGSRSESGTLPTAGSQGYKRAAYAPKNTWAQFTLTQSLIEMSKSNRGAFKKAFMSEAEGVIKDVANDRNRQFHGDGTGKLATLGTTSDTTTVVCTDTKFIRPGMRVDILVITTGAVSTGGTDLLVSAVTKDTSFVVDTAVTTDNTFGVYRAGNKVLTTSYETNGLQNIIDSTGAVGGLNPSTAGQEFWAAHEFGSISTIAEEELQEAWDAPAESGYAANGERLIISDYPSRRQYAKVLTALKQYNAATTKAAKSPSLAGGFDALTYNDADWVADRACASGTAYMIDREAIELMQLASGFKDDDGSVLKDDGGTGYVARHYTMENVGTGNRAAHSKLTGITAAP